MALKNKKTRANVPEESVEVVEDKTEQTDLFGFDAEYSEFDGYTTISGNEQRDLDGFSFYNIQDFDIGDVINGFPEVTIFENNDKDENGEYERKYQSIRLRIIDMEEYVDLYANIPRRDAKGFISNLNHFMGFYRGGFDLVFSFMRWLDETNVYDENGETINKINSVNIDNICKKIDTMEFVKVKIIKGADENYPSWILLDMKDKL